MSGASHRGRRHSRGRARPEGGAGKADASVEEGIRRRRSSLWSMSSARRCGAISRRSPSRQQERATCRRSRAGRRSGWCREQELDKLLENIQNLAQSGSKEMAEQMLCELKDILDRLQTGNFSENAQQQRASQDDEGFERHRLQSAEAARRYLQRQARARAPQQRRRQEFKVSPPGQPMEFGPGMVMAPLFGQCRRRGRGRGMSPKGQRKFQGRSRRPRQGGQMEIGPQPQGQRPGQFDELGQPPAGTEGSTAKPDRPLPHRRRRTRRTIRGAEEAMGGPSKRSVKTISTAPPSSRHCARPLAPGRPVLAEQMMENGEGQAEQGPGK